MITKSESMAKAFFKLLIFIVIGIASVTLLYGNGAAGVTTHLQAARLAEVEIRELVGTNNYQKTESSTGPSLLSAVANTLHLPYTNPLGMLSSTLPLSSSPNLSTPQTQSSLLSSVSSWQQSSKKLSIGWIPYNTSSQTIQIMQNTPGITVISPKWLSVWSTNGALKANIEPAVIQYAHQHHIEVWPLLDNQFSASLTRSILDNAKTRQKIVSKVVSLVSTYKLDGINIDFENIPSDERDHFTAFIKNLDTKLHAIHCLLSVDITPDIVFLHDNAAFFHAGLAADCDYVIVMAYDEHWSSDQTPGPVADIPWVTNAVNDLLDTGVPADQLVLGIPFYERFWHVHQDGSVSSEAVPVSNTSSILSKHHAPTVWNPLLGVAYAKYSKTDGYEEVWAQTQKTLDMKLQLVNQLGLAGVAIWSLNLSDSHTWSVLIDSLRQSLS